MPWHLMKVYGQLALTVDFHSPKRKFYKKKIGYCSQVYLRLWSKVFDILKYVKKRTSTGEFSEAGLCKSFCYTNFADTLSGTFARIDKETNNFNVFLLIPYQVHLLGLI